MKQKETKKNSMTILPNTGEPDVFEEQDYSPQKQKSLSPFEYIKSINGPASQNMMRDVEDTDRVEKDYNPWIVNIGMSYFPDTILHANLINQYPQLDNRPQYEFLINSIRPKKRYAKWVKNTDDEDLIAVCKYYECNRNVGRSYLSLLSKDQIESIKRQQTPGGTENE